MGTRPRRFVCFSSLFSFRIVFKVVLSFTGRGVDHLRSVAGWTKRVVARDEQWCFPLSAPLGIEHEVFF